ncbi:alpha/beta fold hydrolase [Micromonospora sp. 067-2]|uniref:alpha/beta fold hydrolase n=1 Tax=Micromonospora sp. 067-2 TaxID=2789270 RepID=UPI00397C37A0
MGTVVLVHGAWSDGSVWAGVIEDLQRDGHVTYAVQLPATSLNDDIAWTRRQLDLLDGPVTLVGHSSGGMVISGAALGHSRVDSLVFVAGYVPDEGESLMTLNDRGQTMPGGNAIRFVEDGWSTIDPNLFHDALAADIAPQTAQVLAATQKPTHRACFTAPAGPGAWHDLPTSYVVSAADRILDPALQRQLAVRANAVTTELPAHHLSPVSHPREVADVIRGALRK